MVPEEPDDRSLYRNKEVQKKKVPATSGTLPTHSLLFIFWLIAVIIIVGALSFIPALSLGPLVEQLMVK